MSNFLGMKGKAGRHAKHVASKRAKKSFFGSRRKARQNKARGWAMPF